MVVMMVAVMVDKKGLMMVVTKVVKMAE